jgi:2-iminobutanoate/2-iminopropanoate deaminase
MTRQVIRTDDAPASSLYSQAIKVGTAVYVSGTTGVDPTTGRMTGGTIEKQTRQALLNCERILSAAGASRKEIVDVHILLARPDDFAGLNAAYAEFFPSDPPARAVGRLGPQIENVLVSIKMTAYIGKQGA